MTKYPKKGKQLSKTNKIPDKPDVMKNERLSKTIMREKLLAYLPECNWSIGKAGVKAGYTRYYAKHRLPGLIRKDVNFCACIDKLKADIKLQTDFKAKDIKRELWELYRDPKTNATTKARCLELLGKSIAMYVDKGITEDVTQARQLTEAEIIMGKQLAIILLNQKYNKPESPRKQEEGKAG